MNNSLKRKFIHTDAANLFHRQINMTNPALGVDSAIGMSLHLILYSMKKEFTTFKGTHAVVYLEGSSWRKTAYLPYKADRKVKYAAMTEEEQNTREILTGAFDDFISHIDEFTNITVLRAPNAEADDMIAIFIESHPDDEHILISSDSDFYQLLVLPNVTIYDPIKNIRIKQDGIYNDDGKRLSFKVDTTAKIKVGEPDDNFLCEKDWYKYALFLKCVRGDKTDNIFSAYPGVREKGTKASIGIREAYLDVDKGYAWNNFMNQRWVDHNEEEQRVKDCYERNKLLIDLSCIPNNIKIDCLEVIVETTGRKSVPAVDIGIKFMKFCGRWALTKIGNNAQQFMPMLQSKYNN